MEIPIHETTCKCKIIGLMVFSILNFFFFDFQKKLSIIAIVDLVMCGNISFSVTYIEYKINKKNK